MTTESAAETKSGQNAGDRRGAVAEDGGARKSFDAPTRLMHWINALAVILLAFSGGMIMFGDLLEITLRSTEARLKTLHALIGYVVVASLLTRLIWGFAGSPASRWSAVLPGKAVRRLFWSDLVGVALRRPDASAARLLFSRMVTTAIFIVFAAMAVTGAFRAATDIYLPPFGGVVAEHLAAPGVDPASLQPMDPAGADPKRWRQLMKFKTAVAGRIHIWGAYTMLILATLHIAGAILMEERSGGGVIGPMFTGRRAGSRKRNGPVTPGEVRSNSLP